MNYSSQSTSPIEGNWTVADDGKLCTPKTFTAWGVTTNLCWYGYSVGNEAYGALTTDPSSKTMKFGLGGKASGTGK